MSELKGRKMTSSDRKRGKQTYRSNLLAQYDGKPHINGLPKSITPRISAQRLQTILKQPQKISKTSRNKTSKYLTI